MCWPFYFACLVVSVWKQKGSANHAVLPRNPQFRSDDGLTPDRSQAASTETDNTLLLRGGADRIIVDRQALAAGPDFEAHFHINEVPRRFEAAVSNGVGEEGLQIEVGH
jgi:hypothetical protein